MGIHKFTELFRPDYVTAKNNIKNVIVAVDAMSELYRIILGFKVIQADDTLWIKTFIDNLALYRAQNITTIWVFDGQNINKKEEIKKRMQKKEDYKQKGVESIAKITNDTDISEEMKIMQIQEIENKTNKMSFYVDAKSKQIAISILECLGISYIITENNTEAEQIASILVKYNKANAVLSADLDTILFGSEMTYKTTKKTKCLTRVGTKNKNVDIEVYTKKGILKQLFEKINENNVKNGIEKITYNEGELFNDLMKICIMLGTDFNEKTPGIGIATIIKKYNSVVLTDEQKTSIGIFTENIKVDQIKIIESTPNPTKFIEILIKLNFSKSNIEKYTDKFTDKFTL